MLRTARSARPALVVLAIGALVAAAGSYASAQTEADPLVARVGAREIRASAIRRALAGVPAFELAALGSTKVDILRRYVEEAIVHEELLADAARRHGALDDAHVRAQLQKALAGALVRKELGALGGREGVPRADVEAYYQQHLAEYQTPERVRIAHLVVATKPEADALLAKVLADPTRESWSKLVAEASLDPNTKRTAGDLGFVSADGRSTEPKVVVPKPLADAAFALQDGELAKAPVQTAAGWHVVWRRGHVPALVRSLEQEEPTIREVLFEQRQQATYKALVDRLRGASPVQIDEELIPIPQLEVGPRPIPRQK